MIELLCLDCHDRNSPSTVAREEFVEGVAKSHFGSGCKGPIIVVLERNSLGWASHINVMTIRDVRNG